MATDKPRYPITVDEELMEKIEYFRFLRRYSTRSQATVELIRLGLEKISEAQETPFITESEETKKEKDFISMFRKLNEKDKEELLYLADYKIKKNKNTPPR